MDAVLAYLPPAEQGLLPYYLLLVGVVSIGNSVQNLATLHYTRRIYNGLFVPNPQASGGGGGGGSADATAAADRVDKLVPVAPGSAAATTPAAQDQVTPLAARVFAVWTTLAAAIRLYTAQDVGNRALYQLSILTHVVAAAHFTSELLVFRTLRLTGPQLFPLAAGYGGAVWMVLQYGHYVG